MRSGNLKAGGAAKRRGRRNRFPLKKRRGFSLVELLVALPLALIIGSGALRVASLCLASFEKSYLVAAYPGWDSAERLLAFLDLHVRHCGIGLPRSWESDLFSPPLGLGSMPVWSRWGRALEVGESVGGQSFRSSGENSGGTLRLVSGMPSGSVLLTPFAVSAGESARAELSSPVKSEAAGSPVSAAEWVLAPGWRTPLRLVSDANRSSPLLTARRDLSLPAGVRLCRLAALTAWASGGVFYADFNDQSGAQPLFRHIDEVEFRLDTNRRLLRATVRFAGALGRTIEVKRAWLVGR